MNETKFQHRFNPGQVVFFKRRGQKTEKKSACDFCGGTGKTETAPVDYPKRQCREIPCPECHGKMIKVESVPGKVTVSSAKVDRIEFSHASTDGPAYHQFANGFEVNASGCTRLRYTIGSYLIPENRLAATEQEAEQIPDDHCAMSESW